MRIEEVVGANMRTAREQAGLSQTDLGAKLAPHLGDPWRRPQAVSTAETGKRAFTAAELLAISNVLGVSISALFSPPIGVRYLEVGGEGAVPVDDRLGAMIRAGHHTTASRVWTALADLRDAEAAQIELVNALLESIRPADAALEVLAESLDQLLNAEISEAPLPPRVEDGMSFNVKGPVKGELVVTVKDAKLAPKASSSRDR